MQTQTKSKLLETFRDIEVTFKNGDKLSMNLEKKHFARFQPAEVIEMMYAERCEGSYDDKPAAPGVHYFLTANTEYFPATEEGLAKALAAFMKRLSTDPFRPSGLSESLDDFLLPVQAA